MKKISKKQKLHIVFLDFDDIKNPLLSGGQARATLEVAQRLVKLGNKVTIICSRFPGSKDQYQKGIYYKHIGLGSSDIRLNNVVFFAALPFAVRTFKADVMIECFTAPISTCFSPLFTKIPVIGMPTMFEAKEFAKKYHLPFHWVEAIGVKFYKYFLAYSPVNKAKMEKMNPKIHIKIIPNGVSEELFKVKEKESNYALFIGRIDIVQKGLDVLLYACKSLKDKLPVQIIIAGNGPKPEEEKLKELILKNNLSKKVSFVGRVDGYKKEWLLAHAQFGIYPSRFEDFPLVPLEFTALNKPMVIFDVPGLKWVSPKVSIRAKAENAAALSQALVEMTQPTKRKQLKKYCRPFAKQYGWNAIAKQYEAFCHEVIELEKTENSS